MIWCIKQIYIIYTLYNQAGNKCGLISTPLKKIYSFKSLHITANLQFQLTNVDLQCGKRFQSESLPSPQTSQRSNLLRDTACVSELS